MANQLKMAEVQAIFALINNGWSDRRIGRELGIHRETVGRYRRLGNSATSKPASAPLGLEQAPTGPFSVSFTQVSAAAPWKEIIVQKLQAGLSAQRIYQDLSSEHGYAGSYWSVRRLRRKLTAAMPAPFRRMEVEPGAEAQVDFGRGAAVLTTEGKRKSTWVFRIVLSHSRKGYSEAVYRQSTDDFLRCLENAFAHFGGVPRVLTIDNLRAAVVRADWFDPELCPKVRSFAEHYGIVVLPTKPYTPRHKGKIELGIGYVKNNALKGRSFASLAEQNQHLQNWEQAVADTRIHGTTRRQVKEVFEHAEKLSLLPLPVSRFDLFQEALRSVHRDGHVEIKGAYYSVPPEYLGQRLWARWDGRMVRLFDQKMRSVAVHAQRCPGAFSTQGEHILPEKISGIEKGTRWLLRRVEYIGPHAATWAQSMLASRGIEGVRVLMGLLSLKNNYPCSAIDQACQIAQSHGSCRLRCLRQLLEHHNPPAIQQDLQFIQQHPIIRSLGDYEQFVRQAISHQPSLQQESVP